MNRKAEAKVTRSREQRPRPVKEPDEINHLGQKKKDQETALLSLSQKANKKRKCRELSVYLKKAELPKKNCLNWKEQRCRNWHVCPTLANSSLHPVPQPGRGGLWERVAQLQNTS